MGDEERVRARRTATVREVLAELAETFEWPENSGGWGSNALSLASRVVSSAVTRALLLSELNHCRWHLSETARKLGLVHAGNVRRQIRHAGLDDEHQAAVQRGDIHHGPRRVTVDG